MRAKPHETASGEETGMQREHGHAALEAWFRRQPAIGADSRIEAMARPRSGFSAETMMVDLAGCATAPADRTVVLRTERAGRHTFLGSAIGKQARMMQVLRGHGLPAPVVIGWESGPAAAETADGDFLAMERIAGQALPQHPSYHVAGLLQTLDEAGRGACWTSALETIAAINRVPWDPDFAFLHDPRFGPPGLGNYLAWIAAWRDEVCGDRVHPVVDPAIARLSADRPARPAVELLWGDSNAGNFLFDDAGGVAAVLDFEAAAIGPAEIDLSWWFFLDGMLAAGAPLPAGMPDRAGQIAIYEAALGRRVEHLDFYEILAAVRMSLVMARLGLMLVADGVLPPDNDAWCVNPAAQRLAQLIGAPPIEDMPGYWEVVRLMNTR